MTVKDAGNVTSADLAQVVGVTTFARLTGGLVDAGGPAVVVDGGAAPLAAGQDPRGRALPGQRAGQDRPDARRSTGLGDRFNGNVFVSAVHHDIRHGRWFTTAEFGLASEWFADKPFLQWRRGGPPSRREGPPDRHRQAGGGGSRPAGSGCR